MALTRKEQLQTRLLAIVLPILTMSTHILLALSIAIPGGEPNHTSWSLSYNVLAAGASMVGLIGAVKLIPNFVSAYTLTHMLTLSFVTLAPVSFILPFDIELFNPVISTWHIDVSAICHDMGWDDDWTVKCSESLYTSMLVVTAGVLLLILAQWWALWTVRQWCKELQVQNSSNRMDIENMGLMGRGHKSMVDGHTQD
ncbi:hypothetical protein GQ44DRAFT_716536 [Phaeosphaeriaceae sp. PMI808]|nr:hypothetical protein GQ44DRAFT_716536 [Phaeosphaeriaceae sp. PMI808]